MRSVSSVWLGKSLSLFFRSVISPPPCLSLSLSLSFAPSLSHLLAYLLVRMLALCVLALRVLMCLLALSLFPPLPLSLACSLARLLSLSRSLALSHTHTLVLSLPLCCASFLCTAIHVEVSLSIRFVCSLPPPPITPLHLSHTLSLSHTLTIYTSPIYLHLTPPVDMSVTNTLSLSLSLSIFLSRTRAHALCLSVLLSRALGLASSLTISRSLFLSPSPPLSPPSPLFLAIRYSADTSVCVRKRRAENKPHAPCVALQSFQTFAYSETFYFLPPNRFPPFFFGYHPCGSVIVMSLKTPGEVKCGNF